MPSIEKRGDRFRIMVSMGYDASGSQIRKTTTFTPPAGVSAGKAEKLALAFAYEFQKQTQGMIDLDENIKFSELYAWYETNIAEGKLKPAVFASNRIVFTNYILPYLGNMKLKDITTPRIDILFTRLRKGGGCKAMFSLKDKDLFPLGSRNLISTETGIDPGIFFRLANGKTIYKRNAEKVAKALSIPFSTLFRSSDPKRPLSIGTIKRVRTALSPVFNTAIKKGFLMRNPVTNSTIPVEQEKDQSLLNMEQCRALMKALDEASDQRMARVLKALLLTGMRVGELTGLHWTEVDMVNGYIEIKYNCYRLDGQYALSTPKTKTSHRIIAIPPQLAQALREQKDCQDKLRESVGDRWIDRGAVFTGMYGEYMNKSAINLALKKILKANGFPSLHTHQLRHLNASLLINMNVPVKVISEQLGHADTKTTEMVYAHMFHETMKVASDAISRAFSGL